MTWLRGFAVVAVVVIIIIISLPNSEYFRQVGPIFGLVPGGDATGHFVLTGGMFLALYVLIGQVAIKGRRLGVLGVFLLVAVLAACEEASQLWLPRRRAALIDLIMGYAGLGCALVGLGVGRSIRARGRSPASE